MGINLETSLAYRFPSPDFIKKKKKQKSFFDFVNSNNIPLLASEWETFLFSLYFPGPL